MRITWKFGLAVLALIGVQSELFARGGIRGSGGGGRGGAVGGGRVGAVGGGGGAVSGGRVGGGYSGPYGGAHVGGASGRTYVGPQGGSVQTGRVGGVSQGPLGGVNVRGAQGARVTTPGGRTVTTGERGAAGVGPLGNAYGGASRGTAVRGPTGGAAVGSRGGFATGPTGGVAVGSRGGVATGPLGGVAVGGRSAAVGHATRYYSPANFSSRAAFVRYGSYGYFNNSWYRSHTTAWVGRRWVGGTIWAAPVWTGVALFCGIAASPLYYDYGSSVVIQNDTVYVDGSSVGTAAEYATQAETFAEAGRAAKPSDEEEWQQLGVFGLVKENETEAQRIFQLAVNKGGVIRGNYYDAISDSNLPVYGSVDSKSQRAAWSVGEKKDVVFEAGVYNLTKDQTSVLIHFGKERTEQMFLVRLQEPKEEKK